MSDEIKDQEVVEETEQPEPVMAADEVVEPDWDESADTDEIEEPDWAEDDSSGMMSLVKWAGIIGGICFLLYIIFRKKD